MHRAGQVLVGLLLLFWIAPEALSGGSGTPTFAVVSVSEDTHAREPVVIVLANNSIWYAGTESASGTVPASLWWGGVTGFTKGRHPTLTGGGDATIFISSDQRLYWAVLENVAGVKTLNVSRRLPSDVEWPNSWTTLEGYDRPWFASRAGTTYLVATKVHTNGTFDAVELWSRTNSTGWGFVSTITADDRKVGSLPQILPDGKLVVPVMDTGPRTTALAVSSAPLTSWTVEAVPMGGTTFNTHVMSARDADGNVFVAWEDGETVRLSVRRYSDASWAGPHTIADPLLSQPVFGAAIAANASAEVALAWYEKNSTLSGWDIRYRQVSFPNGVDDPPGLQAQVVVMRDIAVANTPGAESFGDFLYMTLAGEGSSVIAFGCRNAIDTILDLPCEANSKTLPRVAIQTGGTRL